MKITDSTTLTSKNTMDRTSIMCERYNVFLGGSCGGRKSPTTWRKEIAIPFLTRNMITFYNPQVDTWTHDLVYKEHSAKENSDVLLFQLETSTRGIASLVEIAYLVGRKRNVIFVSQEEREKGMLSIKDDTVTSLECDDIKDSQQILKSVIAKHKNCQYFSVLEDGLEHIKKGDLCHMNDNNQNTQNGNSINGVTMTEGMHNLMSMFMRVHDVRGRPQSLPISRPITRFCIGIISPDTEYNLDQLTHERLERKGLNANAGNVFISNGSSMEIDHLMRCNVIVAIIPSNCLACAAMCKAAYMLSRTNNSMVLCIEDISSVVDNGNTLLTKSATDDFNRARAYLKNMATNHGCEVFTKTTDAIDSAVKTIVKNPAKYQPITVPSIAEH